MKAAPGSLDVGRRRRGPARRGPLGTAWLAVRFAIAALLLWFLATHVEWRESLEALARADLRWTALGTALVLAVRLLTALRWHLLLRDRVAVSLLRVVRWTFISDFLMTFLPSGIGADSARAWLVSRATSARLAGVSSIVIDRIVGTWVILFLGGVAVAFAPVPVRHRAFLAGLLFACVAGSVLGLGLLLEFRDRARRALERLPWIGDAAGRLADGLLRALEHYRREPRLVAIAIAMAVGLFGLRVVMNYAFGRAVGSSASLYVHAAFLPVIFALNQLPVSVGDALGLRETSTVYFYGLAGIPAATSLAMAVLARLAGYAMASPGALFYILGEVGPERDGERDGAAPTAGRRSRRGLGESAAAPRRNAASACASADVATGAAGPAPRARTAP